MANATGEEALSLARKELKRAKSQLQVADPTDTLLMKIVDALNEKRSRATEFFRKWDVRGDNMVSRKEFRIGLFELGITSSEKEFAAIMLRLDDAGSGAVSIAQFERILQQAERAAKAFLPDITAEGSEEPNRGRITSEDLLARSAESFEVFQTPRARDRIESADLIARGAEPEDAFDKQSYRSTKKSLVKPVTIGVAPRMCQPQAKPMTPPLWASILGISTAADAAMESPAERSTVSVRQVFRSSSSVALQDGRTAHPVPVEERQRVEWRLKHLEMDQTLRQVRYKGLLVNSGKSINSQVINLAGVQGFLRFWPNGYFNFTQSNHFKSHSDPGGHIPDSWCAVGLFMPPGTHFKVRFFVGEERSEPRECYWSDGSLVRQIWMPSAKSPKDLENLVVGVEVFKNCRHLRPMEAKPMALRASPKREKLGRHLESLGSAVAGRSPRELVLPAASKNSQVQRLEVNASLGNLRTGSDPAMTGFSLPSPRFMCSAEMRRMAPRAGAARSLLLS